MVPGTIHSFHLVHPQVFFLLSQVLPRYNGRAGALTAVNQQKGGHSSHVFWRLSVPEYLHSYQLDKEKQATGKLGTIAQCFWVLKSRITQHRNSIGSIDSSLLRGNQKSGLIQGPGTSFHHKTQIFHTLFSLTDFRGACCPIRKHTLNFFKFFYIGRRARTMNYS